jgi:hypothetical protein
MWWITWMSSCFSGGLQFISLGIMQHAFVSDYAWKRGRVTGSTWTLTIHYARQIAVAP